MADEERTEPYVKITRVGRLVHEVRLMVPSSFTVPAGGASLDPRADAAPAKFRVITMTNEIPWLAFGRRHAERLGERKLRQHIRREAWRAS